nr:Ig-like domain-containing protein [Cytophagaceae bacterium]
MKYLSLLRFLVLKSLLFGIITHVQLMQAQPGKDGNLTVTAMNTVVNVYGVLGANVAAGANSVTVSNIGDLNNGTALSAGDLIMIYQSQGASIQTSDDNNYGTVVNYNSAGRYEYAYVASVAGNTINIGCPLSFSYTTAGKTQVVRIPQYNNLTINAGGSITSFPWNGSKGGIVSVHVRNNLVNNGLIESSGKGFRGGKRDNLTRGAGAAIYTLYRSFDPQDAGEKGESIVGYQSDYDGLGGRYGRGAPANGGGGGNAHNAAGGGGANGNNGLPYTGAGVMDPNPAYFAAWQLDPDFVANGNSLTNSSGGGRGGYTFASSNQDALTLPLSNSTWGGDYRDPVGGRGGHPLSSVPENRIFFGGGGGAGDGNNNASADGGDGGGIVYIIARSFTGSGSVKAEGQTGFSTVGANNDAPGGGGGGGSIVIKAFTFIGQILSANGGSGGSQLAITNESEGCGGGGGGGFIAVPKYATGTCGTNNSYFYISGVNGISASTSMTEFPPNGGTYGAVGQNDVPITPEFLPYSLTCIIDRDNDGIHDWGIDLDDDNDGITDIEEGFISTDGSLDEDGDLSRNYADPSFVPFKDDNCDGINDFFDTDLDGIPDFHDLDSDNDGVSDCIEAGGTDTNKDGIVDAFTDANSNGLSDNVENGLIPDDIDGDGIKNQRDRDADGDGITDCTEAGGTDANGDGIIDGFTDTDDDGYSSNVDPTNDNLALTGSNPTGIPPLPIPDSDSDGKFNFLDIDSENDGITDNIEAQTTAGYIAPSYTDTDKDGIYNSYDASNGGTPLVPVNTDGTDNVDYLDNDSDNDNVPDAIEGHDSNFDGLPVPAIPLSGDSDGDGLLNGYDLQSSANATVAGMGGSGGSAPLQDTDSDGTRDWRDTDDDNDCILTAATGITGENTNSNSIWSDDFTQGGSPRPNYLFSIVPIAVTNNARCNTGSVSLSASGLSGSFSWFDVSSGGSALLTQTGVSSSTFATPVISATTTYFVEYTNGTCTVPRIPVVASILSGSSALTVQDQSRCGTGTVSLNASTSTAGTFRWYDAPTGGTLMYTQLTTANSTFVTPSISTTTSYYVEFDNGSCVTSRVQVVAIVNGATPSVTSATRCGSGSVTLSATSAQASTINWYDAATGGTLLQSDAGIINSSYTTISLSSTATYYVEAIASGCPSARVPVSATINSSLANPSVTGATSCGAGSLVLSANSGSNGTFNWYDASSGGTLLQSTSGVSSSTYTTPVLSATTSYYVEFQNGSCTSNRVAVSAVVLSASSILTTNANRCGNGTLVLGASTSITGTFRWFDAVTGGTLLLTSPVGVNGSNYTTPNLTAPASATYYVEFITASPVCTTSRAAVTATAQNGITLTPTPGIICNPGTAALSISAGTSVTFRWFDKITGGFLLQSTSGTNANFTTPFINGTTDFYVEATDGVCTTSPRTTVRASVISTTPPNTTDNSRCGTGTVALIANYFSAGVFRWYDAPTGGTLLNTSGSGTANTYTTPSITTTTTYYVELSTAAPACTTERIPVVANILSTPAAPTAIDGTRCGTGTVTIAAQAAAPGIILWYTAPTGGTSLFTDQGTSLSTFVTPSIAATTTYYAEVSNAYCASARTAVNATVNGAGTPQSPVGINASRCGTGIVSLQATAPVSGIFRWYSAASGGTLLSTTLSSNSSIFNTPSLSSSATYYVEFDNGSCVSSSRTAVTATINTIPSPPNALGNSRCGSGVVSVSASNPVNGTFRWYSSKIGGTLLQTDAAVSSSSYTSASISANQYYYVEFFDGSCASLRDSALAVINTIPSAPTAIPASRCGTGSAIIGASSSVSGDFNWYDVSSGGTLLQQDFNSLSSSFNSPSVSSNTTYYVDFTKGSCTSNTRTPVTITLLSAPDAPNTVGNVICGIGGTAILLASTVPSITHRWYDVPSGGTLLQTNASTTNSSYTTPVISGTTIYYVEAFDGVCSSARTNAIVNAINCAPQIDDEVISTPEDTPISGDLTDVGDSDPEGTPLTANTTPVRNPNHGSIVVNANGTYTYTPNANYNGP